MQNPGNNPTEINGNPAVESTEPLSIQEAGQFALESRKKSDRLKDAVDRLRCHAGKRRERQPKNPITSTEQPESYKAATFDTEADAYQVRGANGQVLFGKSISNGNVRNGQKTRAFFSNDGRGVIDVKPKGRDIIIPKPQPKPPVEDGEFWPVTSAFLYSRIKPNQELLDDNGAASGDETTWDATRCFNSPTSSIDAAFVFFQRFDRRGDYASREDALANRMVPNRLIIPAGSPSASFARDNAVWGSGSADAVLCWYYIGNSADAFVGGKIFKVSGPPTHPNAGNVTESGPGFCMEVYSAGAISAAIFPSEGITQGPLTKVLSAQFPDLGGEIGYAGRIEKWRAIDYFSTSRLRYFRDAPGINDPAKTPTSFPSWYVPNPNINPWYAYTDATWFQFGWPDPTYIGCASTSWILAIKSNINSVDCAGAIPNNAWYWGGDAAPTIGRIDKDNSQGYIGTTGMYVCWAGHKENMGRAMSFFQAFRAYWGIAGDVTYLGSTNPYGCEISPPSGNYPPAPPNDKSRFIGQNWGRKAEMWLKICHQNDPPLEFKLPFEYAAVIEKRVILGGGSFSNGSTFESGKTRNTIETYGAFLYSGDGQTDPFGLENPHATLSIDAEFAYITISYGCELFFEEPLTRPVKSRLGNQGFGGIDNKWAKRAMGFANDYVFHTSGAAISQPPTLPILIKECFTACWFYKLKLPTKEDKTITLVESKKYRYGDTLDLATKDPNKEQNEKFLIHDYRTSVYPIFANFTTPRYTPENIEFASFGGLPALIQLVELNPQNIINFERKHYKPKVDWTPQDWIYYQLIGSPQQINPLTTVLPQGVFVDPNDIYATTIFNTDTKFGRHGRTEVVMPVNYFNSQVPTKSNIYPDYSYNATFPLFLPFVEQLIGNGLIENGIITKWYRVSPSSFPITGQLKRNP